MYPVLTVDGKDHNVEELIYMESRVERVGIFKDDVYQYFYDKDVKFVKDESQKLDMNLSLKWINRYTEVMEEIEKEIDEKASELTELAKLKMENEKQLPFPDKRTSELYYNKEREMIGMIHAASIIEEFID